MSRGKAARPPLPQAEKLRLEQRSHRRQKQRAEQRRPPAPEPAGDSSRRARKRQLALRRKSAAALPRPLRCRVSTAGPGWLGGRGTRGWWPALRDEPVWPITIGILIALIGTWLWQAIALPASWTLPIELLLSAVAALPLLRLLGRARREARKKLPAELTVGAESLIIAWKDGSSLEVPLDSITQVEVPEDASLSALQASAAGAKATTTVILTCQDGATIHVQTTWAAAHQLVATVEVHKGNLAGRRASQTRRRRSDDPRESTADITAPAAAPPPNEAALAALDREGRPLEAWKQALRAAFTDTGYRRAPPLPPDELLEIVGDARISAERRIGAALALSLRSDDDLRARLRVASDSLESETLRVAVERAAEGILEEDALEEAVSQEIARAPRPA